MFFGVEIIVREFSVDALFTVMLAAMIADITAIPFLGDKPFLSGFPPGIVLHHARNYLLVAGLAVIASTISRALSSGTIYTTKLLRRGTDIDRRKVKARSCATSGGWRCLPGRAQAERVDPRAQRWAGTDGITFASAAWLIRAAR